MEPTDQIYALLTMSMLYNVARCQSGSYIVAHRHVHVETDSEVKNHMEQCNVRSTSQGSSSLTISASLCVRKSESMHMHTLE